jgi:hypothetical protein
VKFTVLVTVSGAGSNGYPSSGELVGGTGDGTIGVNFPGCPGGPIHICFPIIPRRFRHSWPMVGFQDSSIRFMTSGPASASREEQVLLSVTVWRRHWGMKSRQNLSPCVGVVEPSMGYPVRVKSQSVATDKLSEMLLTVSPALTV